MNRLSLIVIILAILSPSAFVDRISTQNFEVETFDTHVHLMSPRMIKLFEDVRHRLSALLGQGIPKYIETRLKLTDDEIEKMLKNGEKR